MSRGGLPTRSTIEPNIDERSLEKPVTVLIW
jgi:hypothetical protein